MSKRANLSGTRSAKRSSFILGLLLTLAQPGAAAPLSRLQGAERGIDVGQFLPDLELPRIDGNGSVRLSDYRGRRLLLIQFASW